MIENAFEKLGDSKFSRSKLLTAMGGGLVAAATGVLTRVQPAFAQHEAPPVPCGGYQKCHYCEDCRNGSYCTQYCSWPQPSHAEPVQNHCYSGKQYWDTCYNGKWYRCRDFHEQFPGYADHHCLCRACNMGYC